MWDNMSEELPATFGNSYYSVPGSYEPWVYGGVDTSAIPGAYGTYPASGMTNPNDGYYGYVGNTYTSSAYNVSNPPAPAVNQEQSMKYGEYKASKRKYPASMATQEKREVIPDYDEAGKFTVFVGRDESYPDELKQLLHPTHCELCNMKMNSVTSAKDHYESKAHDRNLTQWVNKTYTEKGETAPELMRFYKQGPSGPDAFYCEYCDLKLTSLTHAQQHYAGKRHRMVISQKGKPSGVGYYNNEGKWVRVSSKLVPKNKDNRFGIGEQHKFSNILAAAAAESTQADTTTENDSTAPKPAKVCKVEKDPSLFCAVCRVSVTSALQMTMHLNGSKHQKKLKASGTEITNTGHTPSSSTDMTQIIGSSETDNVLNSVIKEEKSDRMDLSMYRTPSGQYYCQACNLTITNLNALEQHLNGKRHLKNKVEQKAVVSLK